MNRALIRRSPVRYKDQGRVGVWIDGQHTRFHFPLIARGAVGKCGHAHVLGVRVSWSRNSPPGWSSNTSVSLWGLMAFVVEDTEGGKLKAVHPGLRITFFTISAPVFRRAKDH